MILVYTSLHQCTLGTEMFWLCKQLYINFLLSFSKTICNRETNETLLKKPDICLHSTWKRLDMADIRAYQLPEISARGILARGHFLAPWTLWQGDITALGHFSTGIFWHIKRFDACKFWHIEKQQYGCFDTDILAPVPKCASVPKRPLCQNVPVP